MSERVRLTEKPAEGVEDLLDQMTLVCRAPCDPNHAWYAQPRNYNGYTGRGPTAVAAMQDALAGPKNTTPPAKRQRILL